MKNIKAGGDRVSDICGAIPVEVCHHLPTMESPVQLGRVMP